MHWKSIIPPEDRAVYEAAGYGARSVPGKHPALLVIDVTYGFVGREPMPILSSIAEYPNSCGEAGWAAVAVIARLLESCRRLAVPVYYTGGPTEAQVVHAGQWREKHPATLKQPADANDIVDEIAPADGDVIIRKTKPSAFFGTPLVGSLIDRRIDTVMIAGCTTSGCVRASSIDAFSYGFSTMVIEDAVFDRGQMSHAVNLFDMDQKYANVVPTDDALAYLEGL